jgi:hypothetical protein
MNDIDIDIDEAEGRSPEALLVDLAQLHLQTIASPSPQNPEAMGWRAVASCTSVLAARLLHVVQRTAPEEAARIADWYAGPFGEGPDGMDCMNWLAMQVAAPAGADIETWINEAHARAKQSAEDTTKTGTAKED